MKQGVVNIFIWGGLLFLFSCNKDSDCTPEKFSYTIHPDSKIDTLTNSQGLLAYELVPGVNSVFVYRHDGQDCRYIADEEYSEYLVFEVPSNAGATAFYCQDSTLNSISCYYRSVSMVITPAKPVINGTISGKKTLSGNWQVNVNIIKPGTTAKIVFDKLFVK